MYTVNVLLSTYNGERYVEELINSVLKQKGVNVILSIRDDGSTDRTVDIIRKIGDERIRFVESDKNLKAAKSFLELVKLSEMADFYAFCDQDDVWMVDKLQKATEALANCEQGKEALYMSTYDVVDKDLNFLYKRNMEYEKPLKLETTILFRAPSGCTMVFNKKMRDLICKSSPSNVRMHDFWTLLIALGVGATIVTEDVSLLYYRIHGENTVGLENNYITRLRRLIDSALNNKNERMLQVKCLYEAYGDYFNNDVKDVLLEVINYKNSFRTRLSFALNKNYRWGIYENILFIVSVMTGFF